MPKWEPGTQVRLKNDPGMVGVCTGREIERAGNLQVLVVFPVLGQTFQSEDELERITEGSTILDDWIAQGRFGRVPDLRRHLTHIQLSGRLANLIYSLETTHTDFYAYQYKPVLAFLESPANGLLIADEVGLGKTIEAGLIWTELRARYEARRLLVVCPAMLRDKWQRELTQRFGVEADILGAGEVLKALQRPRADWPDGRAIIASLQGLRPPRGWKDTDTPDNADNTSTNLALAKFFTDKADQEPLVDLLVIDEAHYLRNAESLTAQLGHLLRGVAEHVVLLTATPINIADTDLFNLLNLVDPDNFQYRELFGQVMAANEPLVKARQRILDRAATAQDIASLLRAAQAHTLMHDNCQLAQLIEELPTVNLQDSTVRIHLADRIERVNLFNNVITRTRKRDVTEFRVTRRPAVHKATMHPAETELYQAVTDAIRAYAWSRDISEGFLLAAPQRQVSSCMAAAVRAWQRRADIASDLLYEDFGYDPNRSEEAPLLDTLIREVLPNVDLHELERHDSKYEVLRDLLRAYFKEHPQEKIVVFSYFRETLTYLAERLQQDGFSHQVLVGGMAENKQDAIERFRDNPGIRVLLSSEVASEGVDLQFCRVLVNYDLPWNPMRVEQRIGRLDRLGQTADSILILNLCYEDTIDERILVRLYERLNLFERALGSMEAIIGESIQSLTRELLSHQLTPAEEEQRIQLTATALDIKRRMQEELEQQASSLIAHGGYIIEQIQAIHEFSRRITDHDLLIFVRDYLDRYAPSYELHQAGADPLELELRLPADLAARFDEYLRQQKLYSRTRLATGQRIRCRFVNKVSNGTARGPEIISQFHPLPRFISQDLNRRQESFPPLIAARLAIKHLKAQLQPGRYAFSINRWSFAGIRTEEELQACAMSLDGTSRLNSDQALDLINAIRLHGEDWLEAPVLCEPTQVQQVIDCCINTLRLDFKAASDRKNSENLDRIAFQRQSLEKHRERKLAAFEQALQRHQMAGRKGLAQATRINIQTLQQKVDVKLAQLKEKERLNYNQFSVCSGVVEIQ